MSVESRTKRVRVRGMQKEAREWQVDIKPEVREETMWACEHDFEIWTLLPLRPPHRWHIFCQQSPFTWSHHQWKLGKTEGYFGAMKRQKSKESWSIGHWGDRDLRGKWVWAGKQHNGGAEYAWPSTAMLTAVYHCTLGSISNPFVQIKK